jgi:O-antigen ligase
MIGAATVAMVGTMFLLHRNMPQLSFSVIVLVSGATGLFFLAVIFGTDTFFSLIGRDHTFSGRIYIWELAWASFLDSRFWGTATRPLATISLTAALSPIMEISRDPRMPNSRWFWKRA